MLYFFRINFLLFKVYDWNYGVLSWKELFGFIGVSLISITILFYYYQKLSKSNIRKSKRVILPVYKAKDIFSQEIVGDTNFVLTDKITSIWTKTMVYVLMLFIMITSMADILKIQELF